jgi:signal transduction histidine kinase/CheY-like chemotaxis protein
MPTVNDIKATFVNVDSKTKKQLKAQNGLLLISIGQAKQSGEAFKATLKLLNTYFAKITILVCDTLQRYNLTEYYDNPLTVENIAHTMGDRWIIENLAAMNQLSIPYKIKRWDECLAQPGFNTSKQKIASLLKQSQKFSEALEITQQAYLNRLHKAEGQSFSLQEYQCSRSYLTEEAAVLLCLESEEKYDAVLYSGSEWPIFTALKEEGVFKKKNFFWLEFQTETKKRNGSINLKKHVPKQTNLYFQILSILPNNFYWLDKNNCYLGCNNNQAAAFGLKNNLDVIGKENQDFFNAEEAARLDKINLEVMQERREIEIEETVHFLGNLRTFLSKKLPLYDENNEPIGLLGISCDITDKRVLEEQLKEQIKKTEQALESRMRFISIASHEIRGPVGNVISYLRLNQDLEEKLKFSFNELLKKALSQNGSPELLIEIQGAQEMFEKIFANQAISIQESYRALNSLKNLGDLYQLKTERAKEEPVFVAVEALIKNAVKPFLTNSKNISFDFDVDALPKGACLDSSLEKALQILIGNAVRFSHSDGQVDIIVRSKEKDRFLIEIKDKGVGMSEEHLKHLFSSLLDDAFDDVQDSAYSKPSIQLSIAKAYIEALGGLLRFSSVLQKGTSVSVDIPYSISNKASGFLKAESFFVEPQALRLLLIEDDLLTLSLEKEQLESLGHEVTAVSSGEEGVQYLDKKKYDIVFVDITLSDKSGLEVARSGRESKLNKDTPYIAVTSHAAEKDKDYFILEENFSAVLSKPVLTEDFISCISAIKEALETN